MRKSALLATVAILCTFAQAQEGERWDERKMVTFNLSRSEELDALHGEIMLESGLTECVSGRIGLSCFVSTETDIHGGIEAGLRCNLPQRVSPFVGVGLFLGRWSYYESADNDGIDNDDDFFVDETGEEDELHDYLFAAYPEVGVNFWVSDSLRLTGGLRYYVTTEGRDSDRLLYGIGLGYAF